MERENELRYTSVGSLLIHGPEVLHDDYASRLQKAMGGALPQMDVCVKNLSLSAAVTVAFKSDSKTHELPTVGNVFKRAARALGSRKKQQQVHKSILHQVNAVFRPGTMTLVLGQPGSGKSSLLKVLSGRFPTNKNISIDGEITYNGILSDAMTKHLPQFVSYVPQRDRHYPTLTVKETLKFAHECCGADLSAQDEQQFTHGSADENKAALEAARAMYRHYPDIITQQLGLEHCQDTIVGNAMLRGVSGGERKRVTTGEMSFGNKHVMLMDEISTGLDSAATFDIVKTQRSIAQKLRKTVVMALLQPSPEVFDLFDFVMVLSEGYVLYSGPRDQALPYFASLGFHCSAGRDAAEFLLDIATDKQLQYTTSASAAKMMPQSPRDFAEVFQDSSIHAQTMQQLDAPLLNSFCGEVTQYFMDVPEFHQTYWSSTKTLLARELKVTWRNKALIKGKAFVLGVIGLIYSLLFYQFDVKNPQVVIGTIFPAILFFTLGQGAQLPRFMDAREIFYKQRGANFYRTSSYVIASAFNQIPLAAIESIFFSLLVYWMCGFVADVGAFLMFVLIIFVTNLAFAAWTFFLSSLSPNVHVAEPVNLLTILLYTLFAGFIITHDDIPVYFQWIYWLNPVAWAVRSLAINQYGNHRFDNCHYDGVDYCAMFKKKMGVYSLEAYDIYTDEVWVWFGLAFMLASFGFYMMISCLILENVRYEVTAHHTVAADDEDNVPMMEGELCKIDVESSNSAYIISESPREYTTDVLCEVEVTRKVPVTLAFKDLYYSVPNPANPKEDLELLKGISGFAKPGTITALMGSSGAGKTTLMDVIAGRKTGGKITGQILLNGYEATDLAIRRATGYCEQMDIHMEASTFREALTFSAFLRQSADVPDVQKYDAVEESLELLDLHPIADKIIRGSSVEQMKRLTIGVELAAQPSVLFLDEPTSGLDARAAKLIMDGVRKVADSGRTVVCTIHQPSAEVFQVFDSLLLLKRGGETVFFGELGKDASELVQYFESIDGVAKLEPGYNPATWMLEVIGAGVGNSASQDFVSIFKNSKKKALLDRDLAKDGVSRPAAGVPELVFKSKRAASSYMQAKLLVTRFLDTYWRTPAYVITRTVVFTVLALVFGLAFRQVDYATYHGINAGVGMIFTATLFLGVIALKSVQPLMFDTRDVFYRERASQTYNALWFFVGSSIAEIPYVFFSVLVFSAIFFPLVGFSGGITSLQFWVHLSLHVLLQTYLGQFLAFSLPTLEVSATIATMVIAITFLFMGFNPPASLIPTGYKWLHSITPPKYTLAILSSALFGNCDEPSDVACQHLQQLPPTLPQGLSVKQYIDTVFHASYDDMWLNFAVIMAFIVAFRVLALLALRFINHQKK